MREVGGVHCLEQNGSVCLNSVQTDFMQDIFILCVRTSHQLAALIYSGVGIC